MPAPGQEIGGSEAAGIEAGVVKGQSSATYVQGSHGKSSDLSRPLRPQYNLRIIIVPISLRVVWIMSLFI